MFFQNKLQTNVEWTENIIYDAIIVLNGFVVQHLKC